MILALSLVLGSCAAKTELPQGARQALVDLWLKLPGGNPSDYRILRAWPGEMPADDLSAWAPSTEIWCVEVEMALNPAGLAQPEKMIWITMSQDADSPWSAALLMAMSSIWPYQACGVAP